MAHDYAEKVATSGISAATLPYSPYTHVLSINPLSLFDVSFKSLPALRFESHPVLHAY